MKKMSISLWVLIILFWYTSVCFGCTEAERNGLLKLEPFAFARNNSEKSDCCGWNRVKCDNTTRRIASLDLSNIYDDDDYDEHVLDASLFLPFPQLQYLNLSSNWNSILQNRQELCKLRNIRELYLSSYYLLGSIPPFFDNLTSLEVLDLSNNYLNGFLQDLGRLNKLKVLILSGNSLDSTRIFQSLSALTSLTVLDLSRNDINASLSDVGRELCKLKNLRELYLGINYLLGSIPPCFDNLASLKALDLSKNNLVGVLHLSLHFTSLEYLSLNNNPQFNASPMFSSLAGHEFQFQYLDLSDCNVNISTTDLPKFLHNGSKLLVLMLSNNNLHGKFPTSIFEKNFNLKVLDLRNNSLTGHIHFPIGHPVDLEWFDASYNHIHGELQQNLGYVLQRLRRLKIANNNFGGEIPTSIHAMKDLKSIDLSGNNLSGKLPERLDLGCKRLQWVHLSNNRLEGQIPDNFFNLTKLVVLNLSNNKLSGHIPSDNFRSFNLQIFNVNQNRISGRIPSWLGNLTKYIYHIDLSENQLSGPVPSSLIAPSSLKHLYLQHNKLTGPFPKALPSNTSSLLTLDVSDNNLSGRIPNWFGFLLELRVLSLKRNNFSDSIPHELCRLQKIGIMDISHNNLFGSIPFCFTNITFGKNVGQNEEWPTIINTANVIPTIADENILPDLIGRPYQFLHNLFLTNPEDLVDVQFVTKSRTNYYKGVSVSLMSGMDLSYNNLEGNIPLNIGDLTELRAMNVSHNQFTGVIPLSLSNMKQIESLDLSHNKLNGEIPSNLTRLSFLVTFNVAYNNLSGRVPEMVAQFSTFSNTSYERNPFLCGPPLLKKCNDLNSDLANTTDTLSRG